MKLVGNAAVTWEIESVGLHANGYSYDVAYTLSRSERDTEDFRFFRQDNATTPATVVPSVNDFRQRLAADAAVDLPFAFRLACVLTARTGLPFNITTGIDNSRDIYFTDQPDTRRNSERGDPSNGAARCDVRVPACLRFQDDSSLRFRTRRTTRRVQTELAPRTPSSLLRSRGGGSDKPPTFRSANRRTVAESATCSAGARRRYRKSRPFTSARLCVAGTSSAIC
jgi:hypothetical protein